MTGPRAGSIRSKLIWLTTAIAVAAIALVTVATAWHAYDSRRGALEAELTAIARILADNLRAPLLFDDREAAEETLRTVSSRSIVLSARALNNEDQEFAGVAMAETDYIDGDAAEDVRLITVPIVHRGQRIGTLQLSASMSELDAAVREIVSISGGVMIAATLVAWLLARFLGRAISRPIEHLVETMDRVSTDRDFSQRAVRTTNDETGRLIDGFNEMIGRIETTLEDLAQARDTAEHANQSKTRFLATMSHELRTPLNAIMGFSEVIRDWLVGDRKDAYRGYAADIHDSARYLHDLINDLLDMSRLESDAYAVNAQEIHVEGIIRDCATMIDAQARRKSIRLSADLQPTDTIVDADDRGLRQVILNLIGNAVKFTPEGGRVDVDMEIGAGGTLRITVSDTGPGIPEDDLERVMEPFEQVRSHLSSEHGGAGLGLAISRNILHLHGGTLTLASAVGSGTTATITLPPERVLSHGALALCQPEQSAYS